MADTYEHYTAEEVAFYADQVRFWTEEVDNAHRAFLDSPAEGNSGEKRRLYLDFASCQARLEDAEVDAAYARDFGPKQEAA